MQAGMTLAHARALLPDRGGPSPGGGPAAPAVRIEPFDPAADDAALESLARWCTRLAPVVAPDPPDGLLMDLSGCERYYRGRRGIVRHIARAIRRLGFHARLAMAPTFGCAWAMARFAPSRTGLVFVPDGCQREAIGPLPIRALRIDEAARQALGEVAVDRIDDLLRLPRSSLPSRFGDHLLLRIDQALGGAIEVITPVRPPDPVEAELLFDGPTTQHEALSLAAREVLDALAARLLERGRGTRRVDVRLIRSDLPPLVLELATSRPTCSAAHLWKLLRPRLERAQLGFGVEGVHARALRLARLRHQQAGLVMAGENLGIHDDEPHRVRLGEMVDALASRLGEHRVLRPQLVESHIPERIVRLAGALHEPGRAAACAAVNSARPSILLPRPEPAEVIALWPDGPPSWIRWRGGEIRIARAAGPERINQEWWREPKASGRPGIEASDRVHRDYFAVIGESGEALWLFRRSPGARWFVHGLW